MRNTTKKIRSVVPDIIEGYEVGKLSLTIQNASIQEGHILKVVFCTLLIKNTEVEDSKLEKIDFTFALNNVKEFKRHIDTMVKQAIELKVKGEKLRIVKKASPKAKVNISLEVKGKIKKVKISTIYEFFTQLGKEIDVFISKKDIDILKAIPEFLPNINPEDYLGTINGNKIKIK